MAPPCRLCRPIARDLCRRTTRLRRKVGGQKRLACWEFQDRSPRAAAFADHGFSSPRAIGLRTVGGSMPGKRSAGKRKSFSWSAPRAESHDTQRSHRLVACATSSCARWDSRGRLSHKVTGCSRGSAFHLAASFSSAPGRLLTSRIILPVLRSAFTTMWSPCKTSPSRIFMANGSCTSFWIARFSGRAPKLAS
jgi:hypothetical protein